MSSLSCVLSSLKISNNHECFPNPILFHQSGNEESFYPHSPSFFSSDGSLQRSLHQVGLFKHYQLWSCVIGTCRVVLGQRGPLVLPLIGCPSVRCAYTFPSSPPPPSSLSPPLPPLPVSTPSLPSLPPSNFFFSSTKCLLFFHNISSLLQFKDKRFNLADLSRTIVLVWLPLSSKKYKSF